MRKGKMSKVMSLLLALTMVISLLPQTVIFAAGEGTVTYDFISETIRDNESDYTEYVTSGNTLNPLLITEYYSGSGYTRNWKYFTKTLTSNPLMTDSNGIYFDGGQYGQWMAFKVKGIPEGIYNVTFGKPASNKKGCIWAMYILDAAVYGSADTATITTAVGDTLGSGVVKAAEFDTYGNANATINLGNVELASSTSDERIILFKAVKAGVIDEGESAPTNSAGTAVLNSGRFIAITSLAFEKVEGLKEIKSAPINAVVGEEIEPELTWIGTSGIEIGGEKVIEKLELTKNDDGAVIKTSDGKLYAATTGEATLKVTGKLASGLGGSKSTEIKVTVAENTRTFSGKVLDFNFNASAIKASGETPVYYTAEDGAAKENTYINIRKMTEYCKTSSPARNWKTYIETSNQTSWGYAYMASAATFIQVPSVNNGFASFKLTGIPKGNYAIKMAYNYQGKGALLGAYILDNDKYGNATEAEIRTAIANGGEGVQSVGQVDCYGIVEKVNPTYTFGRADFSGDENSEYILVINFEGAGTLDEGETSPDNGSKPYMYFSKITLDGTYVESVDTLIEASELGIDESTSIIGTSGKWNSGGSIDDMSKLGYVNYAVVEGMDVVELDDDGKTLTTKKAGTAVVETTAFVNGAIIRDRDNIVVDAKYNVDSIKITGNKTAYIGREFRLIPVVKMGDGSETVPAGAVISYEIVSGDEYVAADGDMLVAGMSAGSAKVRAKIDYRGKTIPSDEITVTVTDKLEALSGESFTADLS